MLRCEGGRIPHTMLEGLHVRAGTQRARLSYYFSRRFRRHGATFVRLAVATSYLSPCSFLLFSYVRVNFLCSITRYGSRERSVCFRILRFAHLGSRRRRRRGRGRGRRRRRRDVSRFEIRDSRSDAQSCWVGGSDEPRALTPPGTGAQCAPSAFAKRYGRAPTRRRHSIYHSAFGNGGARQTSPE